MTVKQYIVGAGGGGCFPAGTLIACPAGAQPIESLARGASVWAVNLRTGCLESRVVERVVIHAWDEVHTRSPLIGLQHEQGTLTLTANHWVYAPGRRSAYPDVPEQFLEAQELLIGDFLTLPEGRRSCVRAIGPGPAYDVVYNLEVSEHHTYLADGVVVHNGGGGGKGGGGGARAAVEAPDSLRSTAFARILDLLSEGEIEGLVNGLQSVYLDGTPVQNPDGSFNFSGLSMAMVTGTPVQDPIPGFPAAESEVGVNVEVKAAVPITRTITNETVDAMRVRLAFPGLSSQNTTTGDIAGTSVEIAIDVQANGGGFVAQPLRTIWQSSPNPAVVVATGISITVTWTPSGATDPETGLVLYAFVTYEVRYRVVGAGSWTTHITDSLVTGDTSRTYDLPDLASALYEANVFVTEGTDGSIAVTNFRIMAPALTDVITGKTTSTYQRSYRIRLTGTPPWDIRVRRITADATTVAIRNKTVWDSYTAITDEQFTYPNSAIVGLSVDAQQFSAIPTRGYEIKGIRCRIPSNYNPISRVYTGSWDGTFTIAWTDNPAWCFYDLLTASRYGLGLYLAAAQVDKWALYTIGRYCDGLVPDGTGGTEPRFTCNLYLQTQQEAFQVITALASIFRGMAYWASGTIVPVQDAPADAVFLFNESNVEGGLFTYSGSAKSARHTVALVSWNDPADGYKRKPEYVEHRAGIIRYGVVPIDVTAVGCTSRGMAHRVGDWLLYSENSETDLVVFRAGLDGIYVAPGKIVAVQDSHRAGLRFGGRLVSVTASSVTVDKAVTIEAGKTYSLQVVLPDGTLATKTVTNGPGAASVLTIAPDFAVAPVSPAVWVLTSSDLSPLLYRVLSVTEAERNKYEITGLEHNPSKFNSIESGLRLETPRTSTITITPAAPANVVISEYLYIAAGTVKTMLSVSWDPVPGASRYLMEYSRDDGNFVSIQDVRTALAEVTDVLPGTYTIRVFATNLLSIKSPAATATKQLFGKTARPADVAGFSSSRNGDVLTFAWQAVADLDLDHYELRQGLTWETGVPLGVTINTQFSVTTNIGGTYLLKAVDTTGNESRTAAAIIMDANTDINVVVTANDAPTWGGIKTQTQANAAGVTLSGQKTWSQLTNPWTTYPQSWLKTSDPFSTGTYETVPIDLGAVMTSRVEILPIIEQLSLSGVWADLVNPWPTYTNPWSGAQGIVSASYEMALSQDGVAFGAYQTFLAGAYSARAYKFRITLATSDTNYLPRLTSFLVTVDVPDRVVHYEDQATVAGGTTLTFSPAFVNVQTVTGTIQAGAIGDTFRVTGKTNNQATITVYDSAGVAKAGVVDVDVFGYGSI